MSDTAATSVRTATVEDVPEILAMIRELAEYERSLPEVTATEEQLRSTLFGDQPKVFGHVAVEDATGRVVGMAIWFLSYSTWLGAHNLYLEDLYVRPEARGAGVGRLLLRTLARICVERGYPRFEWWVLDWNPARDFYAAIGADALTEWIPYRVDGEELRRLAGG
jgi:GNAT superfamily N-acetyltransferase